MSLQRLTGLDTAFLAAERPGHALHVMGLLIFDPSTVPGGHSFARFREFAAQRLPSLLPLRRRLVEVPGGLARPYWTDAGDIELDYHLRRAALPSPGGLRELAAMAAEMMERPLDRNLPLWEMVLVEGLADGRIALLAKVSHAMMDGMAGVMLMASLFDTTPEVRAAPPPEVRETEAVPNSLELLADSVPWLLRQPLRAARAGLGTARRLLTSAPPSKRSDTTPDVQVERCWLNAPISPYRIVACCTLPLAEMRAVGHVAGATVNDVLLAVVAGALRRFALARELLPEASLVAAVPVATRGEDDDRANAVTSVTVELATDEADPAVRLRTIRDAMAERKRSRGRTAGEDLSAWADVPPPLLFSLVTRAYVDLDLERHLTPICNLVVSSVPGPPTSLYLAGARLEAIYPLGPVFSGMVLNVTAIGTGDSLDVGLVACRRRVPDLWELANALTGELQELHGAVTAASRAPAAAS